MNDRIAFDIKLMRPACVILQAALGCDPSAAHRFSSEDWLTHLTPDMQVYPVTESQIDQLIVMVRRHKEKTRGTNRPDDQEAVHDQNPASSGVE